jgi:hypothetical protein
MTIDLAPMGYHLAPPLGFGIPKSISTVYLSIWDMKQWSAKITLAIIISMPPFAISFSQHEYWAAKRSIDLEVSIAKCCVD